MDNIITLEGMIPEGQQHVAAIQNHAKPYHFKYHSHIGFCEWTLVLRGKLHHRVGNVTSIYHVGDLIFVSEKTFHELNGDNLSFTNMPVRLDFHKQIAQACGAAEWYAHASSSTEPMVRRLSKKEHQLAVNLFQQARSEPHRTTCSAHVVAGLIDLMHREEASITAPTWLRAATLKIDQHIAKGLTVKDLPSLCERSAAHISRTIREVYGCTPSTWINRKRVARAADYLLTTNQELVDISIELGFSSQSHFTRCFREVFGVSPGKFRSNNDNAAC